MGIIIDLLLNIKSAILPEIILGIFVLVISVLSFSLSRKWQKLTYFVSLTGVLLTGFSFVFMDFMQTKQALWFTFISDGYTLTFRILILLGVLAVILLSKKYVAAFNDNIGEFYALLLTATLGAMLLTGANDLIMIFVALETLSLSSYALCGYTNFDKLSNEASLKYLIFGGTCSAITLYGFSLLYGITSQTNLFEIYRFIAVYKVTPIFILSFLLILGGLCFKISAVPSHSWTPDVYQGAPVPVSAFLAVVSKIAGFSLIIRLLTMIYGNVPVLSITIALVAVLTMTVGNLMAIKQTNLRRLMAYSSIAHAGYILLGLALLTESGLSAMIFYLITYLFMNLGVWSAIEIIANKTGSDSIDSYGGLAYKKPLFAFGLTICLLSLAGIPITAGFFGKLYLFQAIAFAGSKYIGLLIVALLNTLIGIYYYLKVVKVMYLRPSVNLETPVISSSKSLNTALIITTVMVLLIGIFANPFISLSEYAASKINLTVED